MDELLFKQIIYEIVNSILIFLHIKKRTVPNDIDLLKFAAVYGANASGKSNFVTAISFSQIMILNGIKEEIVSNLYNRNKKDNSKRKTRFEYELKINDKIYSYGFSMDMIENKFSEEWLYDITEDEKLIFTRGPGLEINFDYLNFDESSENRLKVYADDTISNDAQLFITALNKDKNKIISKDGDSIFTSLFEWFRDVLEVISPDEATSDFAMTYKNEKYLNKLSNYLKLKNIVGEDKKITETLINENIDRDRIYVMGFSMGGATTSNAISKRPDLFAAAINISGISQFCSLSFSQQIND